MAKKKNEMLEKASEVLLIVGGINWGLAIFDINLVTMLLSKIPIGVTIVYLLVAAAAIYKLYGMLNK